MKKRNILMTIVIILAALSVGFATGQYVNNQQSYSNRIASSLTENIVGTWNDSPGIAAGDGEMYTLFSNGAFKYETSEYDLENRLLSLEGTWQIVHENLMQLTITNKIVLEGGQFEEYELGNDNQYELRNAVQKQIELAEPEVVLYPITELKDSTKREGHLMIKIGGKQFYSLHKKASKDA